jgi:flagellar P-ring protein precursor FlgI
MTTQSIRSTCLALLGCLISAGAVHAQGTVRVKDITDFEGCHSNHVSGIGLVVGLNGTGSKTPATQQAAVNMLERYQMTSKVSADTKGDSLFKSSNISVVMVTAEVGPFARVGSRIDVTVSVLDDATSLDKGVLLMTTLKGIDGLEYAVAQGTVFVGGSLNTASGGGGGTAASIQKNHPTVGRVSDGPQVVREARGKPACNGQIKMLIRHPDYDTCRSIAKVINGKFPGAAFPLDAGTVHIFVPSERCTNLVSYISDIGMLEIIPDVPARVIINQRTGTIVAGQHVKISTVAITHSNLTIVTTNEPIVSQPAPFSRGKTTVLPRAQININESEGIVRVLPATMTVGDLAKALNALGASPRDLIAIFEVLDRHGALQAKLIFM